MQFEDAPTLPPPAPTPSLDGADLLVGRRLGPYHVISLLGEGGFGSVYLAEQSEPVRRRVALKILRLGMDSRALVARFEAERQALAMMDHPGVARVFDAGVTPEGRPFFAMELVRGEPLDRFCDGHDLGLDDRVRLAIQIAEAAHHAHMKGVVHRDLKPSNILVEMVDRRPVVRIIDFGVAKAVTQRLTDTTIHTERGQLIGTPEYMSPEQARGDVLDVDIRADVYSIGAMLYQLLTGVTPIDSGHLRSVGMAEIPRLIEQTDPIRPSELVVQRESVRRPSTMADVTSLSRRLRRDLDWIVMKCLEKDRDRRYDSASALAADLSRYLAHEPVEAGPPSASYRLSKFVRRHRGLVAAMCSVAAVLVLGGLGTSAGLAWALHERDRAAEAGRLAEERAGQAMAARAESEAVTGLLLRAIESVEPGEGRRDVTALEVLRKAELEAEPLFVGAPGLEATVRHALGTALWALGHLEEAGPHLGRSLELRRATLGEDHPDTLRVLSNFASLRLALGEPAEAERLYTLALEGHRRIGEGETPEALGVMNNLAQTLDDLGRRDEAIALQRETLEAQRRVLGDDDANTFGSMANLATMIGERGQTEEAERLLVAAAEGASRRFGADHPDTLLIRHKLGLHLERVGRHAEALREQRAVLEASERVLGAEHPSTIGSRVNLALTLQSVGQIGEAERLLREAFGVAHARLGERHQTTLSAALSLLGVFEQQGWPERVLGETAGVVLVLRRMGEAPGAMAGDLNSTAWLLLTVQPAELQQPREALSIALRACELERGGPDLWMYLDTLALARSRCGLHAEAVETQREALALLPEHGEPYRGEMEGRLREFEIAAGG